MRLVLSLFALSLLATPAVAAVTLRDSVTLDRDQVLVGDLFDGAGDQATQPVGSAPAPGQKSTYDVAALGRVARAYNLDWKAQRLDARTVVTRASTKVTTPQIQEAVTEFVTGQLPVDTAKAKLDIQLDRRTLDLDLPADIKLGAIKLVDGNYDPISFRFTGTLTVDQGEGRDPFMLPLTGRAVPQLDVPIVAKRIEAGTVIGESDLDTMTVGADRLGPELVRSKQDLIGKEAKRALPQGATIATRDLQAAQLVKRGALVTMIVERGELRITAKGRALADGAVGQTVRVLNLQSNKTVEGVIDASGDVHVTTNG